ncbi:hypothetical protein J6590_048931 [Homalodisca vitripennis]|nr:hypothetical protein J6590_048931 [Homalodisca vitripennis]
MRDNPDGQVADRTARRHALSKVRKFDQRLLVTDRVLRPVGQLSSVYRRLADCTTASATCIIVPLPILLLELEECWSRGEPADPLAASSRTYAIIVRTGIRAPLRLLDFLLRLR